MRTATLAKLDATIEAIRRLSKASGYPPTIREVADALGIGSTTAYSRLLALRFMGRLTWRDGSGRTLRIISQPRGAALASVASPAYQAAAHRPATTAW